jgi:hypothetical protein
MWVKRGGRALPRSESRLLPHTETERHTQRHAHQKPTAHTSLPIPYHHKKIFPPPFCGGEHPQWCVSSPLFVCLFCRSVLLLLPWTAMKKRWFPSKRKPHIITFYSHDTCLTMASFFLSVLCGSCLRACVHSLYFAVEQSYKTSSNGRIALHCI